MIGRLKSGLAALVAAIVAILGTLVVGRRQGAASERQKQQRAAHDALNARKEVSDELDRESPDDRRRRLDGWMRPDD